MRFNPFTGNFELGSPLQSIAAWWASMNPVKTSGFTAEVGKRYICLGTFTVTDPSGTANGDSYEVIVASGSVTIGGVAYGPSRWPLVRYYNGSTWATLANTLTDNLTLNGTANTAPNQTAASGSSIMTRALLETRSFDYILSRAVNVLPVEFEYPTPVGSGATYLGSRFVDLRTGNTINSLIAARTPGTGQATYQNGTTSLSINFAAPVAFRFRVMCFDATVDGILRCYLGRVSSSTTDGDPSTRTIGIKIIGRRVWLQVRNSTTTTTTDSGYDISATANGAGVTFLVRSDGAGNAVLFADGTQIASSAGAPTSQTNAGDAGIWFAASNPSTDGCAYAINNITVFFP